MEKFLKIFLFALAMSFAISMQADNKPKSVMNTTSDVPKGEQVKSRSESQIIAVRGKFEGIKSCGEGCYQINCRGTEDICFVYNDPTHWVRIDAIGQEFEVLEFHGSETQGDTTVYSFSLNPIN